MSNLQFFILLGTVLAGVIWQRLDVYQLTARIDRMGERLDSRIDSLRDHVNSRIDHVGDDLRQFYQILGRHDKAIDTLEKRP